jgi:NAD(P)-dependent dehydrogenase (short-subunit alcohol dehydrogenase family)
MSKLIVITGANRGIGLEIAKLLSQKGIKIIGTARNPESATELKSLENVVGVVKADQGNVASYSQIAANIEKLAPEGIDELWNVRISSSIINRQTVTKLTARTRANSRILTT